MKKLTCIMCPMGCELSIEKIDDKFKVSGNGCIRGERYGVQEMTNPTRMITTLIKTANGPIAVKTTNLVPKDKIFDAIKQIHKIKVENAKIGQIVLKNLLDLDGVNVVVTRLPQVEQF